MNKRQVDWTKKSNIKCEHCAFWMYEVGFRGKGCTCLDSPKYKQSTHYWNRCKHFEWKEGE